MGFGVWGLGFGVWGLGFGVWGLGFGVWLTFFEVFDSWVFKGISGVYKASPKSQAHIEEPRS